MSHNNQKKIAVINDFCGFGKCSLSVSLPIISAMKLQCCPLPTAIFSNHTEFDSFASADFTENMPAFIDEWVKLGLSFDGILTGFLASEQQIEIVKGFLKTFKTDKNITVIDPVMGDGGKLYPTYSPALAGKMAALLPFADIITPNLTEACILSGKNYKADMNEQELTEICEILSAMGPKKMVISGIEKGENILNFVYECGKKPLIITEEKIGPRRSGTGDVFASIIAADSCLGKNLEYAVLHASVFISNALKRTVELNLPTTDGICFEEFLGKI